MTASAAYQQAIALNRFGLGARPDDTPPADPQRWLAGQLDRFEIRPAAIAATPDFAQAAARIADVRKAMRDARGASAEAIADARAMGRSTGEMLGQHAQARLAAAAASDTPFVERLVHFWANHFAISVNKLDIAGGAGPFEFEAIRPHVLGRFSDMLMAVETHPTMLIYLDQQTSVGPSSPRGAASLARGRARGIGLNENLAREIMELHTLGVRSGYSQADVTEFARALTGWTVSGSGAGARIEAAYGQTRFLPEIHEPGDRTILGRRYPDGGEAQSRAVLADLALRPETANHIATKLARHFIADDPPAPAVARLSQAYLASGGDLPSVYRALIASPEAWTAPFAKFKSPWDWLVSSWRALGPEATALPAAIKTVYRLGQPVWQPGSPAGWPDIQQSWAGPDELVRRVEAARVLVRFAGDGGDAASLAPKILPGGVGRRTGAAIGSAGDPARAYALLLVSPEFQRR